MARAVQHRQQDCAAALPAFLALLVVGFPIAVEPARPAGRSAIDGCLRHRRNDVPRLLPAAARTRDSAATSASMRKANDANRVLLLGLPSDRHGCILVAIGAEAIGNNPQPLTKGLIIVTLALAWLFATPSMRSTTRTWSTAKPDVDCVGSISRARSSPIYWDFVYFAFTCGMAFATSDVQHHRDSICARSRRSIASPRSPSTSACSPSPSTCSGSRLGRDVDLRQRRFAGARQPGNRRRSAPRRRACRARRARGRRASRAPRPTGSALYSVTAR